MSNTINIQKSQEVSKRVRATAKNCFTNAFRAIVYYYPDAVYIEGVTVNGGLSALLEHAWLEIDGQIIDPTWCNRMLPVPKEHRWGFGNKGRWSYEPAIAYFPVLRLNQEQVFALARQIRRTYFLEHIDRRDIFSDEQREARKAARDQAMKLIVGAK